MVAVKLTIIFLFFFIARTFLSVIDYPEGPISIGQMATITYLVADDAEGVMNDGPASLQVNFVGSEVELPPLPIARSSFNEFTYIWEFTVASFLNTTIETSLSGKYDIQS